MNYRTNKINGDELSILGFGCMRFPKDEKLTEELILHSIESGVNYFDTAYMYLNSEAVLGRILAKNNMRSRVKIATKIPPAVIRKYSDFDKYFDQQLKRLQTDHIDYYLMHMLTDESVWNRMAGLGAKEWIQGKKKDGSIKNIGFSFHGGKDEFIKICDAYDWEFCMIQYNYFDENNQAGVTGLKHAAGKGIPVMVMEPLRGGILANRLPKGALSAFDRAYVKRSPAEWAFRWLWDQPEVTCVLSGMNSMDMLKENIRVAETAAAGEFGPEDFDVITRVRSAITDTIKVPCTGCGYCMPCPQGADIPTCLSCYNNITLEGKLPAVWKYIMQTSLKSKPQSASMCNGCGRCLSLCPQGIDIPGELEKAKQALERFYFKPLVSFARWFMKM